MRKNSFANILMLGKSGVRSPAGGDEEAGDGAADGTPPTPRRRTLVSYSPSFSAATLSSSSTVSSPPNLDDGASTMSSPSPYTSWYASPKRRSTATLKTLQRSLSRLSMTSVDYSEHQHQQHRVVTDPVILANMQRLQDIIADRTLRQSLISSSLAVMDPKSGYVEKLRFCSCVEDFKRERAPDVKLAKARKIVSIFIECGSMFQCDGVPDYVAAKLRRGEFEEFDSLVGQFTEELAQEELLMANCRRILNKANAAAASAAAGTAPLPPREAGSTTSNASSSQVVVERAGG